MLPVSVPRTVLGPTHRTVALTSGALLLLVVTANLPALLVLSFTRAGADRSYALAGLITAWSRTLAEQPCTCTESHTHK